MKKLKNMLDHGEFVMAVGCYDPLSAMALVKTGFKAAYLGGWSVGAHLGVSRSLTTMTEMAEVTRSICHISDIPLIVDAGPGYGGASMAGRCMCVLEEAGAQGIQFDDRAAMRPDSCNELISQDEMLRKLESAAKSRKSGDFALIAGTSAESGADELFEKKLARLRAYATVADLLCVSPGTDEEMRQAAKLIDKPLCYVAYEGGGKPIPTPDEVKTMGYAAVFYPLTAILAAYQGASDIYRNISQTGRSGIAASETKRIAEEIMAMISIDELAAMDPAMEQTGA